MKERPILFSGPMVRAILEGSKTQTRRLVKPQPASTYSRSGQEIGFYTEDTKSWRVVGSVGVCRELTGKAWPKDSRWKCPYGQPGDRLWVRETFYCDHYAFPQWKEKLSEREDMIELLSYRASDCAPNGECYTGFAGETMEVPWSPSIHMPRWASRIDLVNKGVRIERLQDISEADALAERIYRRTDGKFSWPGFDTGFHSARAAYFALFVIVNGHKVAKDGTISKEGLAHFDSNPWLWVIDFERVKK